MQNAEMTGTQNMLENAVKLASEGFFIFPLKAGEKLPLIKNFPNRATTLFPQLQQWWQWPYNIGIYTGRYGAGEALIVVDVDIKKGKNGLETLASLKKQGFILPKTRVQKTPTGGLHLIYKTPVAVGQSRGRLGSGIDIRSQGGYIVAAGSEIPSGAYTMDDTPIAAAPDWLVQKCGEAPVKEVDQTPVADINIEAALSRAEMYLKSAPPAIEGQNGDDQTYKVSAKLKDFGLDMKSTFALMAEHYNPRCQPPWPLSELEAKIQHAFAYGIHRPGADAPEAIFDTVEKQDQPGAEKEKSPIEKINEQYAFVLAGGGHHILWETKDVNGHFKIEHLSEASFHKKFASKMLTIGDGKTKPLTQIWMSSPDRRSYDGLCFRPEIDHPGNFYNLWRGFNYAPADSWAHPAVQLFIEHVYKNVCQESKEGCHWFMSFFAQLIQRPWDKPAVALVLRGSKGVGKNVPIEHVGKLLGNHALLSSNRRFLVGNFNGHLENLLLFTLNEAFWSGDKMAESILKELITGQTHVVELKGKEPYTVENRTRVVIIGNEDWLVPATHDERRFTVFDVGEGRKQDHKFFSSMHTHMLNGGYPALLRFFMDYDIKNLNLNHPLNTKALADQKEASMEPFMQWWLDCLHAGKILHTDFDDDWPSEVAKDSFRSAFKRYCTERNIRSRLPEERWLGRTLKSCCPDISTVRESAATEGRRAHMYRLPGLDVCRQAWVDYMGCDISWE